MIINLDEQMDISALSEAEKTDLARYLISTLKAIRSSMLRSDWHAALEAVLHLSTDIYGSAISLLVEEELGIEPPRADFIIVRQDKAAVIDEPIFDHFRIHNIIEYKNPNDDLNERVLWKTIGYAGLYISERGVDEADVTLTIIRARRDNGFFNRMERAGRLKETGVPGVYKILAGVYDNMDGVHDNADGALASDSLLPTRIILTDELKGERYASYRALSNKPNEEDIKYLIDAAEEDEEKRKYIRVILNLVAAKHPEMIEKIKGRDKSMTAKWMEIFKDEIAVERAEARIQAYAEMVDDGDLSIERAAEKLGMTVQEFQSAAEKLKVVTA